VGVVVHFTQGAGGFQPPIIAEGPYGSGRMNLIAGEALAKVSWKRFITQEILHPRRFPDEA
jgi:hypothetical protein